MKRSDDTVEERPAHLAPRERAELDSSEDEETEPALVMLDEPASERADRYAFRKTLGSGGMGEIFLVRDVALGRDVAMKQLRPNALASARTVARFEHEARLQGQLEHPAIVPVYDLGARSDGTPFFTMKRVRGEALSDILERRLAGDEDTRARFGRRRLVAAIAQIALAAHYAHERGVVHRDIKPGNIMLGDYGEVYLLDWGIAKVVAAERSPRPSFDEIIDTGAKNLTGTGTIVGTLRTIAPEQAINAAVDHRADVYSLGAVLFEILTGEGLHGRGAEHELLYRIIEGVDPRPALRAAPEAVPPELEAVVARAVQRRPSARYQDARALHDAIQAYLDGDRDLETRRAQSRENSERAEAELQAAQASEGGLDTNARAEVERAHRTRALRFVGQALALDPENKGALRTLVTLLMTPPREVPPEVRTAQEAMWRRQLRRGGIVGAVVYGYISLNALFTTSLGVHDWTVFWAAHALWGAALLASVFTILWPSYGALFAMFLFGTGASVWVTGVYGPHLLVPVFISMHAAAYAAVRHWWLRGIMLVIACVGWTVAVFGEMGGLFPDVVRFEAGGIFIKSPVIDFPETLTTMYLYAAVLAVIVFPALIIGALRNMYHAADERTRLQAWQLHQLVPDEVTSATAPPPSQR